MNRHYLLVMLVVCLLVGCVQAWGADFGAWDYRKEITVNNTGSNLTNYQVLFTVNRSTGSDSGFTTYLGGKCESDYDDIRFTTGENTPCDYWIESNSSTVASIWVEVPSIVNSTAYGSTTMYLYYGNSGASAVSNGTNTFPEFFDDFSSGTLDTTTKWKSPTSHSISDGVLQLNPTSTAAGALYSKSTHNFETYILRGRHKSSIITANYPIAFGFNTAQNHNANNYIGSFTWESSDAKLFTMQVSVAMGTTAIPDISNGANYYVSEIRKSGNTVYLTSVDSSGVSGSTSRNSYTDTTALNYIECEAGSGLTQYYDWILMRKYTATEPTVSAWGSETAYGSGWTAENTATNLPITTSWTTYKIEGIDIDTAGVKNIGVFIWVDDTDAAADDLLYLGQIQLCAGDVALPFEPKTYEGESSFCQRYYQRLTVQTENGTRWVSFPVTMRSSPTLTTDTGSTGNQSKDGFNLTHTSSAAADISATSEL